MDKESVETLLFCYEQDWNEYIKHFTLDGKPRDRLAKCITCKYIPATADKLVFILSYFKNNPLQENHAACFGMTQSQAHPLIYLLSDNLLKTLKRLLELPEENHLKRWRVVKEIY